MANSTSKLDQALMDLIEAYSEIASGLAEKHGEDEDALNNALVEVLETSIDSAVEEQGFNTSQFASMLSCLTEALEQIDPSAFEDEDEDYEYDIEESDIDLDDDDADDDEEEDEDDEEE